MKNHNALFYFTGVLQLFIGIGAVAAGIGFMMEPDGSNLSMSVELLKESPFKDFLIPGIVLFSVNGIGSLIGCFLSFKRHPSAGTAGMILGMVLIIWIVAQVYWIHLISWLQPLFFIFGMFEFILGYLLNKMTKAM